MDRRTQEWTLRRLVTYTREHGVLPKQQWYRDIVGVAVTEGVCLEGLYTEHGYRGLVRRLRAWIPAGEYIQDVAEADIQRFLR
jgi:hypothetical protein